MKAVVHEKYGPPEILRFEEVERPVPKDDEVLIRIKATTVNRSDTSHRAGSPFVARFFHGVRRPRKTIPGSEFAGEVEAVGRSVTEFAPGDRVFGVNPFWDVLAGTHAEYASIAARRPVAHMPEGLTFEEAAAVPDGAILALGCLERAGLRKGQKILVHGASGSIGTAGVQLSRYFDAHVTAVCNTKNLELVRSLGADEVIDYTKDDFTKNGKTYDVVFDSVGKHSFRRSRRSLKPKGIYIGTDLGFMWHLPLMTLLTRRRDKRAVIGLARYTKKDVLFVKQLIEAGEYRPVIDRQYPLERLEPGERAVDPPGSSTPALNV